MMRRMLGAPLGGTTVGGQYGLESTALSLITPPNFGSGGGSCFPSIVVVALGEPGVPVVCICCARIEVAAATRMQVAILSRMICLRSFIVVDRFVSPEMSQILLCPLRYVYRTLGQYSYRPGFIYHPRRYPRRAA